MKDDMKEKVDALMENFKFFLRFNDKICDHFEKHDTLDKETFYTMNDQATLLEQIRISLKVLNNEEK